MALVAAVEADYRAIALRLWGEGQLRGRAEQVLWKAQAEQHARAVRQHQRSQGQPLPRELQDLGGRG